MTRYRIWCVHPESDFSGWIDGEVYVDRVDAEVALKEHYDGGDGYATFEIHPVGEDLGEGTEI